MNRAAVIIAVQSATGLPQLKAALDGANRMEELCKLHKFDPIVKITDEQAPVTAKAIKTKVKEIVETDACEQLFIYFAGHGVNNYTEFWLLSDAMEDPQEAVNVFGSVQLAKRSGIPHVVFISDACRTAAEGIRAQTIRGSEIFPSQSRPGPYKAVDVFYASLLGDPALEIQDKANATTYVSEFTNELVAALKGERQTILAPDPQDPKKLYLRPHPLKRHLMSEVPRLVAKRLGPNPSHSQTPDADILSDEFAFLQEFDAAAVTPLGSTPRRGRDRFGIAPATTARVPPRPATAGDVAATALKDALRAPQGAAKAVAAAMRSKVAGTERISEAVAREGELFSAMHYETGCGFKLRGAALAAASAHETNVEVLSPELARVAIGQNEPAVNVLLELTDGRAVLLPALRDFITALTFEEGQLRNVSYEPSDTSWRWPEYAKQRKELTTLRGLIAASVQMGTFRLESADAPKLTERIRFLKGLDPTMALYAAYSYHRLGKPDLIREMETYLRDDLRMSFFDIDMLADREGTPPDVYPFFPMLAQGWSLLGAFGAWTPLLEKLRPFVETSLWTVFEKDAVKLLRKALKGPQ